MALVRPPDAFGAPSPGAWWHAVHTPPSSAGLDFAARRCRVVVLNAWHTAALHYLRRRNPRLCILVYKCLASTRSHPGVLHERNHSGRAATGLRYRDVHRRHPEWFATDTDGRRIEWQRHPQHWLMTVWDRAYQQEWAAAVAKEVMEEEWDGVLADNDLTSLRGHSSARIAGTSTMEGTDELLRDGFDELVDVAGQALTAVGRAFVPNIVGAPPRPGARTAHGRFGGTMEGTFALPGGAAGLPMLRHPQWNELRAQAALGESWLLLSTRARDDRDERIGFGCAALLAGPRTVWTTSPPPDEPQMPWSRYQSLAIGVAPAQAIRLNSGVWTRVFTHGWVAANPTSVTKRVAPPAMMNTVDGIAPTSPMELAAGDAAILVRPH